MSVEALASRAVLIAALRDGTLEAGAADPGPELIQTAIVEGVLPLLEWRLRGTTVSSVLQERLAEAGRTAAVQALFREMEMRKVADVLARHGINTLLLKGNALGQWLYPEPYLRVTCDIDLLFESRAVAEQAAVAFGEIGYELGFSPAASNYEMTSRLVVDGVSRSELDLHCRLLNAPAYADIFAFEELCVASLPLTGFGDGLRALCSKHALAHACLNRALDMQTGFPDQLKLLYDIHLLVGRMDADAWQQFLTMVREKRITGICLRSITDTVAAFNSPIPVHAMQALHRQAANEPIDWRRLDDWRYMQLQNLKSLQGPWAKLKWIWDKVFPTRSHLQELHGDGGWMQLMGRRLVRGVQRLRG